MTSSQTSRAEKPGRAWLLAAKKGDVHPCDDDDGWPEFSITLEFYVSSDDPEVVERERQRLWDLLPDLILEATDA